MPTKGDCNWCDLKLCEENSKKGLDTRCLVEVIRNSRPKCSQCIMEKNKEPLDKLEELVRFFQLVEGNPEPCFRLSLFFRDKCLRRS